MWGSAPLDGGGGGGFGRGGGPGGGPAGFGMLAIDIFTSEDRSKRVAKLGALGDLKELLDRFWSLTPRFFGFTTASKLGHQSLDQVQCWLAE